jgi:hypothetical protein
MKVTPQLKRKIVLHLTTSFDIYSHEAELHIPEYLEQWGRLQIANGGDLIQARGLHKLQKDIRAASFVRVSNQCNFRWSAKNIL